MTSHCDSVVLDVSRARCWHGLAFGYAQRFCRDIVDYQDRHFTVLALLIPTEHCLFGVKELQ